MSGNSVRWLSSTRRKPKKRFRSALSFGDAYIVAQDLGHAVLKKENAIEEIIEAVKKQIFPLQAQEAKELYRVGSGVGGVMSNQPGESMTSYTGRRKRWYRKLKELDASLEISDTIRADLLLDNCGLDRKVRLMILTAVGDKPSFDAIEKAFITQRGNFSHFLESKAAPKSSGFVSRGNSYKGSPYKGKGKGKKGSFQPMAYLADPQDLFEDYGEEESVWDPESEEELVQADDNVTAFLAGSLEDATAENIELDVMEAEVVAYFARLKAKGKGMPMGQHAHGYNPRKGTGPETENAKAKRLAHPGFFNPGDFADEDEDEELVEDDSFEFLEPPPEGSDTPFSGSDFTEDKHYVFPQSTAQRRDFFLLQKKAEDFVPVRDWIALENPHTYGEEKKEKKGKGRGWSKSPAATWEPKGSVFPAPNGAGDGLVDRVKAENANRERKETKETTAASSSRDMKMKHDEEEELEFLDDLTFVENLSLDDGYDLSDIVNWDVPELEKITYVFLRHLFAAFRPTETSAVDGIMKKYSDELIALMGCVAKKYVDGT
ncbi:GIP [Symbiodinium sp. CCMP2592]|nr:GIP [Symbiodinium sp. CCMP2592]